MAGLTLRGRLELHRDSEVRQRGCLVSDRVGGVLSTRGNENVSPAVKRNSTIRGRIDAAGIRGLRVRYMQSYEVKRRGAEGIGDPDAHHGPAGRQTDDLA